jgi:RecA/RadA recombinase
MNDQDWDDFFGDVTPSLYADREPITPGYIGPPEGKPKINIITGAATATLNLEENFLLQDIIPLNGLTALYGAPGSGKSFWTLHAALAISQGIGIHGKYSERTKVVYCAMEGRGMFKNRVAAYCKHHNLDPARDLVNFGLVDVNLDLRSEDGQTAALSDAIEQMGGVGLIIIDTLNRVFGGGNENSSDDMGQFLTRMSELEEATGASVLVVHHSGKDSGAGLRGHSSFFGAVDSEIKIERLEDTSNRILTVSKSRDGEDGIKIGFATEVVTLGETRKRGTPVTSLVCVDADIDEMQQESKSEKLGTNQRIAYNCLKEILAEPGCPTNPSGPGWPEYGKFNIADVDILIEMVVGKLSAPEIGKRDQRKGRAIQAIDGLVAAGIIGRNHDKVWRIKTAK